jgi:hypothetical protein
MRRPQARRAFDLWRAALTSEHRAAGWLGERQGYAGFVRGTLPPGFLPETDAALAEFAAFARRVIEMPGGTASAVGIHNHPGRDR